MKFEKAPPWIVEAFASALEGTGGEPRRMFGYPAGFANGNMACGVFGRTIFVRVNESDQATLLKMEGAGPFAPMGGRPSRNYVVLAPAIVDDEKELRAWLTKAVAFAGQLPPKSKAKATRRR